MKSKSREGFVINAMNAGLARAAKSFSILLGSPVKINAVDVIALDDETNFSRLKENDGELYVLVTQMIGDFTGKSYLIFNQEEATTIESMVQKEETKDDKLKEAFLMEIDNIVSAAVISELSDVLKAEIYGDVPMLKRLAGVGLYDFIATDKAPCDNNFLLINTGFSTERIPTIHPQFIWRFDPVLLEMIPASLIAVQNR